MSSDIYIHPQLDYAKSYHQPYQMSTETDFSSWLQAEMDLRGWNITEVAKRIGVAQSHISNILSGKRRPSAKTLQAMAKAMGVPPALVFQKAGFLPPSKDLQLDPMDLELLELFDQALSDQERQDLLDRMKYEVEQLARRRNRTP